MLRVSFLGAFAVVAAIASPVFGQTYQGAVDPGEMLTLRVGTDESVEIESEGAVQLDLWLRFFVDQAIEQDLMRKFVRLGPGRNRIGVLVPQPPIFFYPAFRVTGEGEFCVTSFSLTRWDPAPRDEQPATTEPSPEQ